MYKQSNAYTKKRANKSSLKIGIRQLSRRIPSNTDMLSQLFHKVNLNFVLLARRETDLCLTEYLLLRNLIPVETNDFETI